MKIQLWSENFMTKFNYLALFSTSVFVNKSVPIFLCLQNTVNALLCIIQMASGFREYARYFISLCCVLNLVSATAVIFYGVEESVRVQPYYGLVDTLSRFVMSFSSLLIFTEKSSLFVSFFICTNFISSIFIPIYKTNNLEELSETETFQPLISEEL
ncbi:hypothetical protein Avbf_07288 [Armadillidium vulgare]|nr:hypothetical protein Avbf_07288 [Armadillidium vulgare]